MSKKVNKIAFYVKREGGTLDELILDLFESDFELNENLGERDLWEKYGGGGREFQLEPAVFEKLLDTVVEAFRDGTCYTKTQEEEDAERRWRRQARNRELASKERLWRAIKWECSEADLEDLRSYVKYRYEQDDYYDFQLILDKIHAFMAGECSVGFFVSWLILLMRCLEEGTDGKKRRRKEIYYAIADWFDGAAFMPQDISEEQKRFDCLRMIAVLKYFNHQLNNLETKKEIPFTKNGVITYVTFAAYINGDMGVDLSKVCIVDEDAKTVNYLFVPNLVYREEVNYTFLTEAEFDCLMNRYYDYTFDGTMKEDYAATKGTL